MFENCDERKKKSLGKTVEEIKELSWEIKHPVPLVPFGYEQ